jgi:rSAM/selenodomain-associated transferase 2
MLPWAMGSAFISPEDRASFERHADPQDDYLAGWPCRSGLAPNCVSGAAKALAVNLSIVIPTLNAGRFLPGTLAAIEGDRELIVADGGSTDDTIEIATAYGANVVRNAASRGQQLIAGAAASCGGWLLFLHADTVLQAGWREEVEKFAAEPANASRAATFRFALDDASAEARRLERLVAWRVRYLGLPYGDQGLIMHREFYRSLGGFRALPLMEDVDLIRRIGRHRLTSLSSLARTSAERWRRDGWRRRSIRNLGCLTLYLGGVPPRLIVKLYN